MTQLSEYLRNERRKREQREKLTGLPAPLKSSPRPSSNPLGQIRSEDPSKKPSETQSTGSLGPIDFVGSTLYHGLNSALMGLPDLGLANAYDGWTPYDLEETNNWGKVGGIIGEAAGFLIPVGAVGKSLAYPVKMLAGSGKSIRAATKAASNVAANAVNKGAKVLDASGKALGNEAAQKVLRDEAKDSIAKTLNKAVDNNLEDTGIFTKLWRSVFPDKPKKWIANNFNPTVRESIRTQHAIRESVEAGLRRQFRDVLPADSPVFKDMSHTFLQGLQKGNHLNSVGAWMTHGLGAGSPSWLRQKMAGYAGRYADMFLTFGVYNGIDEILKRKMEPEYESIGAGQIAEDTAMFAAVLPLIEAIPGGVAGAMTWKNYQNVVGIMKRPKYKGMSRAELTTYYDYIRAKMPGMAVGNLDDAAMSIRKGGIPSNYNRDELAEGLGKWYDSASKKFFKEFRGEQAANFVYSLPRMVAGAMYFGGAASFEDGFFGEQFRHHLHEDPASVATHMLTGVFFTRHRKPLSKDMEGKWGPNKVHFKEEYQEQLDLLTHMGYNAEGLQFYLSSLSKDNIEFAIGGLAYRDIAAGKNISEITQKYIDLAKSNEGNGELGSKLNVVGDKNLIEAYHIWRSSQASRVLQEGESQKSTEEIERVELLQSLTDEQRQKFSQEISEIVVETKTDGTSVRIGDLTWSDIRYRVFDEKILNNHHRFFQNVLMEIANKFQSGEGGVQIVNEKKDKNGNVIPGSGKIINLPRVKPNGVTDMGELLKYEMIAKRLVSEGKAVWATGTDMVIDAKELKKVTGDVDGEGKPKTGFTDLAEMVKNAEDMYGSSILGENINANIDFSNLNITWNMMSELKERSVMEKLIRVVNGSTEELSDQEAMVYEHLKVIFKEGYNENWLLYTGDSGSDILMRGAGISDKEKWDKEKPENADDIMKVLQMAHELMQYTPLSSTLMSTRTDGQPRGIRASDGEALLTSLQESGLLTPGTQLGPLSTKFRRYLYERAVDNMDISDTDFSLIRHHIDSSMLNQSVSSTGQMQLEPYHPETIRSALRTEGASREEAERLTNLYTEHMYKRITALKGLVKEAPADGTRLAEVSIIEQATNPNIKNLLSYESIKKFIEDGVALTEPKIQESIKDLVALTKVLGEDELQGAIWEIRQLALNARLTNKSDLDGPLTRLKQLIIDRKKSLTGLELETLQKIESALDNLSKKSEEYDIIKDEDLKSDKKKDLLVELRGASDAIGKLKEIIDDNGNLLSRANSILDIGRIITNFRQETSVQSVAALANLKRELVKAIEIDGKETMTIEQLARAYEKEGKFKDFISLTNRHLKGALDTLDRETLDRIRDEETEAYQEWMAHIQKARFTISPDTVARQYSDTFMYDPKTKSFSETLKQQIIAAWAGDIEMGGARYTGRIVDRMIESIKKKHPEKLEEFAREELPKLIHTLVTTEKKAMFRYDARLNQIFQSDSHGAHGAVEDYIDWWHKMIPTVNSVSRSPELQIVRISRSAIDKNGYVHDIGSQSESLEQRINKSQESTEQSSELINKSDRLAGEGLNLNEVEQAAGRLARKNRWIVFGVDGGGYDLMVDYYGISRTKVDFIKAVQTFHDTVKKQFKGNDLLLNQFEAILGESLKRVEAAGDSALRTNDIKNVMRWMYYYNSNTEGFKKVFGAETVQDFESAQASLFKYAITAQGENAGRLNEKLAEIMQRVDDKHGFAQKNKDLARFLSAASDYKRQGWKFKVSVIRDEGDGNLDSVFSTSAFLRMSYTEMAYDELKKLTKELKVDTNEIFEDYKVDLKQTPEKILEDLIERIYSAGEKEVKTSADGLTFVEGKIRKFKKKLYSAAGNEISAEVIDIAKNKYVEKIRNIVDWTAESIKELERVGNDVSTIDGVTYLSTKAARMIFGLNGFAPGQGFAGVKPVISYNSNELVGGKGAKNETFIGKTSFIYDPRVAEHLDKKGIDMMMGKSAAKSFSGEVQSVNSRNTKEMQWLKSSDIFEHAVGQTNDKSNFLLPLSSIGVVYNAGSLHPSKAVPVVSIGMNRVETADYAKYMNLKDELYNIATNVGAMNDERRMALVNSMVEEAKLRGFELDVGGGGLGMQLYKLGMDATDPLIKREVIRIFHKATGGKLGGVEKPGAGVSVMIPETDATLPIYKKFKFSQDKFNDKELRRQIRYGGIKVPYDMGIQTNLYDTKESATFIYDGERGQDIVFRENQHIDQTEAKFIVEKMTQRHKDAETMIDEIDIMIKSSGFLWKDISVADLHQLINLRFDSSKNMFAKHYTATPKDKSVRLFTGNGTDGLTENVEAILKSVYGDKFNKSTDLFHFTQRLNDLNLNMAVPGTRIPSQSFSDVVINRLEGIYSKKFGNVVGSNSLDVVTKHQGDYDIDKMFYYLDAPLSLITKGIRNSGYNIEPGVIPANKTSRGVDLFNNDYKMGAKVDQGGGEDGVERHKQNLHNNKFLIGRINRLNYSLMALRESEFLVGALDEFLGTKRIGVAEDFGLIYSGEANTFENLTPQSERKMAEVSQAISTLSSMILDPHKNPHKAAFQSGEVLLKYILFGEWPSDAAIYGRPPLEGTTSEGYQGIFAEQLKATGKVRINGRTFPYDQHHKEVLQDAYVIGINTMGRAARVFSGLFDESGQRAPEYWEYNDIKDSIERFRKEPTQYIFGNLAWKYRNNPQQKRALFDLFVQKGWNYGEFDNINTAIKEGRFNYSALNTNIIRHKFEGEAEEAIKQFWDLTPANIILHGLAPQDGRSSIYAEAIDGVNRGKNSNYSYQGLELINNASIISAMSGEGSLNDVMMESLWRKAESDIQVPKEDRIGKEQKRDILWQVLDKELRYQNRFLGYLKGNKYHNTYENDMVEKRVVTLNKILEYVQNQSIKSDDNFKRLNEGIEGEKRESWADVSIKRSGRNGTKETNFMKHAVVLYEVNMPKDATNLDGVEYNTFSKGVYLRPGDYAIVNPGKQYVILKNPIRNVSTSTDEFLHGLAAFSAGTTLNPESFRLEMDKSRVGKFFRDIDDIKKYIRDESKTLKQRLREDKNRKDMAFAINAHQVNDALRLLIKSYVPGEENPAGRINRLTDIFELLTLVEPLHGSRSSLKGLKGIDIPVFIQNRDIFRAVSKFYMRDLGAEGQEVVQKYLTRKSNFYRMFKNESHDFTDIERGIKDRLFKADGGFLPEHLQSITSNENIMHDIINGSLRRFNDYAFFHAFSKQYDIQYNEFSKKVSETRRINRPWGATDDMIMIKNYANSVTADALKVSGNYKTTSEWARQRALCPGGI